MAVPLALAVDVTTDELMYPNAAKKEGPKKPSLKIVRRMQQLEKLPENKQVFILTALDSLLRGAIAR